ncbi:hypothetical protein [Neisseria sicca]|nr:hypothetical protein [Neisseria sicca]
MQAEEILEIRVGELGGLVVMELMEMEKAKDEGDVEKVVGDGVKKEGGGV